jgi:predicted secreted protein
MPAQKGKDLLLKVDSDGEGDFTTIAGLRARSLSFNATTIDVTDQESTGRWREGHVAFFDREEGGRLICFGGNQSDRVCFAPYPKLRLLGFRWPSDSAS